MPKWHLMLRFRELRVVSKTHRIEFLVRLAINEDVIKFWEFTFS